MKVREAAVGVALAGTLAACASQGEQLDTTAAPDIQGFVSTVDSQATEYAVVNCDQAPNSTRSITLDRGTTNQPNAPVTLGASEQNISPGSLPDMITFIGGVTLYDEGHGNYLIASSNQPGKVQSIDISKSSFVEQIPVKGKRYHLLVSVGAENELGTIATVSCRN